MQAPTRDQWMKALAQILTADQALETWLDAWEQRAAELTPEAVVGAVRLLKAHQDQTFVLLAYLGATVKVGVTVKAEGG